MKQLIVRFINEPGLVSTLIRWNTDSLFCHTEALSRDGRSWIGAHAGTGVEARPADWCKPTRERRYAVNVTEEQFERAMSWLEAKVGTPYGYKDIVGLTIHKRMGLSDHELICSALMTLFLIQGEMRPLNVLEQYAPLITPETLHLSPIWIGHCVLSSPTSSDNPPPQP